MSSHTFTPADEGSRRAVFRSHFFLTDIVLPRNHDEEAVYVKKQQWNCGLIITTFSTVFVVVDAKVHKRVIVYKYPPMQWRASSICLSKDGPLRSSGFQAMS